MGKVFRIHSNDNVATAIEEVKPGRAEIIGPSDAAFVMAAETIPKGHKIALQDIPEGSLVVKYGVVIGKAVRDIPGGSWVHLPCMHSLVDERSSHLDPVTGAPSDILYE